jgi:L-amino acid N-acyltransferase YncA
MIRGERLRLRANKQEDLPRFAVRLNDLEAGFVHEGRLRQAEFKHGEYMNVLLMSVLRPEWEINDTGG